MSRVGRPPKSLEQHIRDGTFRWDRHGRLVRPLDEARANRAVEMLDAGHDLAEVAGAVGAMPGWILEAARRPPHAERKPGC